MIKQIFYMAFASLMSIINIQAQTNYYVSQTGNDAAGGIQAKPFASINMTLVEACKTKGIVVVNLMVRLIYKFIVKNIHPIKTINQYD